MRTPNYTIMQGSTPTVDIEIPLDISGGGCVIYLDLIQNEQIVLEYNLNGTPAPAAIQPTGTLTSDDLDGRLLHLNMTQSDTLRLKRGDVGVQLRFQSDEGDTDTSEVIYGFVGEAYKKDVIV